MQTNRDATDRQLALREQKPAEAAEEEEEEDDEQAEWDQAEADKRLEAATRDKDAVIAGVIQRAQAATAAASTAQVLDPGVPLFASSARVPIAQPVPPDDIPDAPMGPESDPAQTKRPGDAGQASAERPPKSAKQQSAAERTGSPTSRASDAGSARGRSKGRERSRRRKGRDRAAAAEAKAVAEDREKAAKAAARASKGSKHSTRSRK